MTKTRKRRLLIGTAVISLIVVLILFVVTPALAVQGIIAAAKAGDAAALESRVDFPALRGSLKDELNARMRAEVRDQLRDEDPGLAALGMMLAPSLMDSAVDVFVTPDAVAAMVSSAEAPGVKDDASAERGNDADIRRSYGFRDPNTFVVTLTDPERAEQPLKLLLERRNLVQWKLAGVDLPDRV
ncbi:DUF2939 domain-containing protein [Brevundimonas variabilis]|uniref:DUF2939 domain-containing protein n=1 Tax=Brevundimonas variabilis TaxID=74312 RepID=A0A7W9FGL2_9CAUL|nr:DUF2939 domain-containing protein [Brevundimonas variabilis]MBB5746773.1 hypothetical protein [Brevundimonas variabilis]